MANIDYKHNFFRSFGVFGGMGVIKSVLDTTELGSYESIGSSLNTGLIFVLTSF